jgi:hypothetical protein
VVRAPGGGGGGRPAPATAIAVGEAGGTVAPTLSLAMGAPAAFGAFVPGVARTYEAATTATVVSTAGDAALTVADPSSVAPGRLVNGAYALREPLTVGSAPLPAVVRTWAGPVSQEAVGVAFRQRIGADEALRTGAYAKTLTFTLTTTMP